ncbi:vir protein B5 [Legionella rubrilucens]|uniref:Vir protein B5 n=1 Tax=Legionella rubrilucens TaxID=458 RepID=A0A0W0XZ68_9GAMM|nr:type IV secretion system protein [Legionella rubrilucens]KTD49604.1 vir protein B5 [Legionella rubrilucens]
MKIRDLVLLLSLASLPVHADILSVADAAMLTKAIEQLEQLRSQYQLLSQTYSTAQSQLENMQQLKNFNSGHYGFGGLANSHADLNARQWSPNTWDDALHNIAGGNPARYQELVKAYQRNHVILDDATYRKGASLTRLKEYKNNVAVNQAVSVQATYAFNEVNRHLKAIHDLSNHIDKAANTKAAIDLNSRLLAEIAYIQTENLKLQTLMSQQVAQESSTTLATENDNVRFNALPDE